MNMGISKPVWICAVLICIVRSSTSSRVAVYEHRPIIAPRASPLDFMMAIVDIFEEVAKQSAKQGVELLVFPGTRVLSMGYCDL